MTLLIQSPLTSSDASPSQAEIFQSIGRFLKNKREEQNLLLEETSQVLKIRSFFIKCIEEGDFLNLPGGIYTWGFVKSYCDFLKIDPLTKEDILKNLKTPSSLKVTTSTIATASAFPLNKAYPPRWSLGVSCLLSLSIALAIFFKPECYKSWFSSSSSYSTSLPTTSTVSPSASGYKLDSVNSFDPSKLDPSLVTFYALSQTWIKVSDGEGRVVEIRLLSPTETYSLPYRPNLYLTTGDRKTLKVYRGQVLIPFPVLIQNLTDLAYPAVKILEDFPLDSCLP